MPMPTGAHISPQLIDFSREWNEMDVGGRAGGIATHPVDPGRPQPLEGCYEQNNSGSQSCNLIETIGSDRQSRFLQSHGIECLLSWQSHWHGEWQSFIRGAHMLLLMKNQMLFLTR